MNTITDAGCTLTKISNNTFELSAIGNIKLATMPGVICENPTSPETERIYKKTFLHTPIYMPDQYQEAIKTVLYNCDDVIILGMNGFSMVGPEQCAIWGVKLGAYEAACENLLSFIIKELLEKFVGIQIRLVNGASDLGIDKAILNVAKKFNIPLLGHSCPTYLFYVQDNGVPVFVAKDQPNYSDAFTESLEILITANGGQVTFKHDIDAAFNKGKHIIPLKVLQTISSTGGPPAFDSNGKVVDAVTAFEQRVHMVATHLGISGADQWKILQNYSRDQIITICRSKLSPKRAFSHI